MFPQGKRSIYQSHFVAACEQGGHNDGWIQAKISKPLALSKNQQDKFITLEVWNDSEEVRFLTCENASIETLFTVLPQDRPLWLRAAGSREQAVIEAADAQTGESWSSTQQPALPQTQDWGKPERAAPSGPPASTGSAPAASAHPSSAPRHQAAGPGMPSPQGNGRQEQPEGSMEEAFEACLEVGRRAVGRFYQRHGRLPIEQELSIAIHLSISHQQRPGRAIAHPHLQKLGPVLQGKEKPAPAAHEAALEAEDALTGEIRAAVGERGAEGPGSAGGPIDDEDDDLPF